ncbi:hypothetical protein [Polaribacter sp. Hel1_85]|uniref:hypothetical protein n=1 Tax=Polaribacter sp. Hel1_85 TaxID=1250005 RepID=UPI00052C0615|nr:hypothetical protein [Polaribacter sp. Hel1_85]KGL62866.1 carbamoyl-phosphate synthase small subunit [Polaribacter sp. Hel1_85]
MKKATYILIVLLSVSPSFAQGPQGNSSNLPSGSNGFGGGSNNYMNFVKGEWVKNKTKTAIDGSFYLYDDWTNLAQIFDFNNKGYKLLNCNFNIKLNRIEAKLEDGNKNIYAFNSKDISKFYIKNTTFVSKDIDLGVSQLLEVIYESDKLSLYKAYVSKIKYASVNPMTQRKIGKDRVVINNVLYIEKGGELKEIKLKKSTILKLLSNKKGLVKKHIKKNNLLINKQTDLINIFNYYNSL